MKLLFSLVILANAGLIFWIELLFARKLLPTLGGAPAIWNTCLMFYQVLLLAGYAYALLVSRMELRRQVALHGGLLVIAAAALPWLLFVWPDPAGHTPILWLTALLTLSLGAPFFLLSAGAPLLQRWFSLSGHPDRRDPYFLYAASNLGSFLALAGYPLLLEPLLTLELQMELWKGSFAGVVLLVLVCGVWVAWRRRRGAGGTAAEVGGLAQAASAAPDAPDPYVADRPLSLPRRLRWLGLAFIPSSLLLGVTTHITSEIAPVPLLWVVPLSLYLLTFVVAFGPGRRLPPEDLRGLWRRPGTLLAMALAGGALGVLVLVVGGTRGADTGFRWPDPVWLLVLADLAILAGAGLVCHTRIARDRPHPRHLAEYFLWLAVGGALGGVFNTLVAPVLFTDPLEYPLVLAIFAFLVASRSDEGLGGWRASDVALGLLPGAFAFASGVLAPRFEIDPLFGLVGAGLLCLVMAGRPVRFGLGVSGLLLVGFMNPVAAGEIIHKERTFYGIHRIYQDGTTHWLAHGTTIHGGQRTDEPDTPLTYYHPAGPAGSLFEVFGRIEAVRNATATAVRVANVGLGTGSLIAYGRAGQEWSLYELDPSVVEIAEDPQFFTYLRDAEPRYRHVLGDARISLERTDGSYDLIVIDAFSSDAIPVHLLTLEALELYLDRLHPGGLLAFHISNRYADFSGVLADLAAELELFGYHARDEAGDRESGYYPSHWAVLAHEPVSFADPRWEALEPTGGRIWTDSYSSLFRVLTW